MSLGYCFTDADPITVVDIEAERQARLDAAWERACARFEGECNDAGFAGWCPTLAIGWSGWPELRTPASDTDHRSEGEWSDLFGDTAALRKHVAAGRIDRIDAEQAMAKDVWTRRALIEHADAEVARLATEAATRRAAEEFEVAFRAAGNRFAALAALKGKL